MNKVFYPRIAMINLRNNGRTYVPYLLTCILSTAMFYVICSLSLNPDLDTMLGGGYMRTLLQMGTWIVGFFELTLADPSGQSDPAAASQLLWRT